MLRGGRCCLEMGAFTRSREYYARAVEIEPKNSQARAGLETIVAVENLNERSTTALEAGDARAALFYVEQALQKCPQSKPLRLKRADALLQLGRLAEALDASSEVLREDTSNADATMLRGLALYRQGNAESAKKHFQQALRLDPDYSRARVQLKKLKLLEQKKAEGNDAFKAGQYQ